MDDYLQRKQRGDSYYDCTVNFSLTLININFKLLIFSPLKHVCQVTVIKWKDCITSKALEKQTAAWINGLWLWNLYYLFVLCKSRQTGRLLTLFQVLPQKYWSSPSIMPPADVSKLIMVWALSHEQMLSCVSWVAGFFPDLYYYFSRFFRTTLGKHMLLGLHFVLELLVRLYLKFRYRQY